MDNSTLIVVVAALEPLEIAHRAIEAVAQLLDLRVERLAFRRLAGEEREKSALAAAPFGVRHEAVEIGLLLAGGIFVALDLLGAGRVAAAAIERGHLAFQAHTDRVGGRLLLRGLLFGRRRRRRGSRLARNGCWRHGGLGGSRGRKQASGKKANAEPKPRYKPKSAQVADHSRDPTLFPRRRRHEAMEW